MSEDPVLVFSSIPYINITVDFSSSFSKTQNGRLHQTQKVTTLSLFFLWLFMVWTSYTHLNTKNGNMLFAFVFCFFFFFCWFSQKPINQSVLVFVSWLVCLHLVICGCVSFVSVIYILALIWFDTICFGYT